MQHLLFFFFCFLTSRFGLADPDNTHLRGRSDSSLHVGQNNRRLPGKPKPNKNNDNDQLNGATQQTGLEKDSKDSFDSEEGLGAYVDKQWEKLQAKGKDWDPDWDSDSHDQKKVYWDSKNWNGKTRDEDNWDKDVPVANRYRPKQNLRNGHNQQRQHQDKDDGWSHYRARGFNGNYGMDEVNPEDIKYNYDPKGLAKHPGLQPWGKKYGYNKKMSDEAFNKAMLAEYPEIADSSVLSKPYDSKNPPRYVDGSYGKFSKPWKRPYPMDPRKWKSHHAANEKRKKKFKQQDKELNARYVDGAPGVIGKGREIDYTREEYAALQREHALALRRRNGRKEIYGKEDPDRYNDMDWVDKNVRVGENMGYTKAELERFEKERNEKKLMRQQGDFQKVAQSKVVPKVQGAVQKKMDKVALPAELAELFAEAQSALNQPQPKFSNENVNKALKNRDTVADSQDEGRAPDSDSVDSQQQSIFNGVGNTPGADGDENDMLGPAVVQANDSNNSKDSNQAKDSDSKDSNQAKDSDSNEGDVDLDMGGVDNMVFSSNAINKDEASLVGKNNQGSDNSYVDSIDVDNIPNGGNHNDPDSVAHSDGGDMLSWLT